MELGRSLTHGHSYLAAVLLLVTIVSRAEGNQKGDLVNVMNYKPDAPTVPSPSNLIVKSYNFNTTLCWDFKDTSADPRFQVEFKVFGNWSVVETCQNISQHYCDLSEEIYDPNKFYKIKIKAFVGPEESESTMEDDFSIRIHGKIGPPTLNASVEDGKIVINIGHPLTPYKEETDYDTIRDFYEDFSYDVYYNNKTVPSEDCDDLGCTVNLDYTLKDKTYCISAQGKSNNWVVVGEKSKDICVYVGSDVSITKIFVIVSVTILSIMMFTVIIIFVIKLLLRGKSKIPGSLNNVFRNVRSYITGSEQEPIYDRVTATPITPNEESVCIHTELVENEASNTSGTRQSDDAEYQSSLTATEEQRYGSDLDARGTSANNTRDTGELNSSNESSTGFNKESNDCDTASACTTIETNKDQPSSQPPSSSYGYDKPHIPVDIILKLNKENYGIESCMSNEC